MKANKVPMETNSPNSPIGKNPAKNAENDRGYGLGRSAGEFPVAMATKEMREQRPPEAH